MSCSSSHSAPVSSDSLVLGIDVSKQRLDLAFSDGLLPQPLAYDDDGLKALLALLRQRPVILVVVESTGGIEAELLGQLLEADIPVTRVEPSRVRAFARAGAQYAKTDKLDARVLAEFGLRIQTRLLEKRSKNQTELDALVTTRSGLVATLTQQNNRLRTLGSKQAARSINNIVKVLKKEIQSLDKQIASIIDSDDQFRDDDRLLRSVPGVGIGLASMVLACFSELGTLSRNKAAALLGVAPFNHDSGNHKGARHIRGGRADLRKRFYMAGLVAMQHNPVIKAFADRLKAKNKPPKVVIVAAMRKLATYLNTMLKHRLTWSELNVVKQLLGT